MLGTSTSRKAEITLADAWRVIVGPSAFRTDYPLYLREPNLNLVEGWTCARSRRTSAMPQETN
jgi:hypothetical protein